MLTINFNVNLKIVEFHTFCFGWPYFYWHNEFTCLYSAVQCTQLNKLQIATACWTVHRLDVEKRQKKWVIEIIQWVIKQHLREGTLKRPFKMIPSYRLFMPLPANKQALFVEGRKHSSRFVPNPEPVPPARASVTRIPSLVTFSWSVNFWTRRIIFSICVGPWTA